MPQLLGKSDMQSLVQMNWALVLPDLDNYEKFGIRESKVYDEFKFLLFLLLRPFTFMIKIIFVAADKQSKQVNIKISMN